MPPWHHDASHKCLVPRHLSCYPLYSRIRCHKHIISAKKHLRLLQMTCTLGLRPFSSLPSTPFQNSQWMPQWVLEGKVISQKHPFHRPQRRDTSENKQRVLNQCIHVCSLFPSATSFAHAQHPIQNHESTCYKPQPPCLHADHSPRPRNQATHPKTESKPTAPPGLTRPYTWLLNHNEVVWEGEQGGSAIIPCLPSE